MFCLPTTPEAVVSQAERLGAAGRVAYDLFNGTVVKMAYDRGARRDNQVEYDIWNAIKDTPTLARWFAPVYDCQDFGAWQIMHRLTNRREAGFVWDYNDALAAQIVRDFKKGGWKVYLSDLHGGNWGRDTDGNLRILDYGYCAVMNPSGEAYGNNFHFPRMAAGDNGTG